MKILVVIAALFVAGCSSGKSAQAPTPTTEAAASVPESATARVTTKLAGSEAKNYNAIWWRDGSYRYADLSATNGVTFNAKTFEFQNVSTFEDTTYVNTSNGQSPITAMQTFTLYDRGLAQWVAANSDSDQVSADEVDGRQVWNADLRIPADELGIGSPNRAVLTVDQETLIVLSETLYNEEGVVSETTLTEFAEQAEPAKFEKLTVPAGAETTRLESNFEVSDANGASTLDDVEAPRMVQIPDGYELGTVAVESVDGPVSGAEGVNPPSDAHAVWTYQGGWKQFFFSVRSSDQPASAWVDPFGSEGKSLSLEKFSLTSGLLSGATVEFSTSPYVPHAWTAQGQFEVDLSGPLVRSQFETILNNLE